MPRGDTYVAAENSIYRETVFVSYHHLFHGSSLRRRDQPYASAWVFTAGYVLSIVIALAGGVSVENNGLHKIREQAMAMKSNINVIRGRIDNILFQLDPIVENQMNHEKEIYLKVSRNEAKKYRHLKSLGEVKASLSAYPVLRSDETVMRLFSQIVKEYEELANAKMAYNGYASQYNAGIKSFPVVLFRALSREGALEYYEDPTDENIM